MAHVSIYTADGGHVEVQNMPDSNAMALVEELTEGDADWVGVSLDGTAITHIAVQHIVRVDVDQGA